MLDRNRTDQNYAAGLAPDAAGIAGHQGVGAAGIDPANMRSANMRSARDFKQARRHSRLVRSLRFILPLVAIVLIGGFFVAGILWRNVPDAVAVDSAAVSDGKLIMNAPNLSGFDKQNRPYDVKAERATQNLSNTHVIDLENIDAKLPADNDGFANLAAGKGSYDSTTETLKLNEAVEVQNSEGTTLFLEQANVDLKAGEIVSDQPVKVKTDRATITAESVELFDKGERIVFKNRVKMTIAPGILNQSEGKNPLKGVDAESVSGAMNTDKSPVDGAKNNE